MRKNNTVGTHTGWSASNSEPYIKTLLAHRSKSEILVGNQGTHSKPDGKSGIYCMLLTCSQLILSMSYHHVVKKSFQMESFPLYRCVSSAARSAPSVVHALNHSWWRSQSLNLSVWTCETQYEPDGRVFPATTRPERLESCARYSSHFYFILFIYLQHDSSRK